MGIPKTTALFLVGFATLLILIPATAIPAPPGVRVTPIPAQYRKIGESTDKVYLDSREFHVLNAGRCAIIPLDHFTERRGNPDSIQIRRVGILAIDLHGGAVKLLQPDSKIRLESLPDNLYTVPLGKDSVGISVSTHGSSSDASKDVIWRWTPAKNRIERIRQFPRLVELLDVLDGTPCRIAKPADRRGAWTGRVTLASNSKRKVELQVLGKPIQYASAAQQFLRGSGRNDLIVYTAQEFKSEGIWLQGIQLDKTPAVQWKVKTPTLETAVGMKVQFLSFPNGVVRGYKVLPFVALTYAERSTWLCSLNPQSGRVRKVQNLKKSNAFAHSSADGSLVVYDAGKLPKFGFAVVDMLSGKRIVNRILKLEELGFKKERLRDKDFKFSWAVPVGFMNDKSVVVMDEYNLWTIPHPYTGRPKLLFSLTKEKPGYCCSK